MKRYFLAGLLFIPVFIAAQIDSTSIIYSNQIDSLDLRKHILVLSNDSLLGRETANEGQKKTEKYLVEQFKSIGLKPAYEGSYVQNFDVVTNRINSVRFSINGNISPDSLDIYSTTFINDTQLTFSELLFIGHGISCSEHDDYKDISVAGKLVFMYEEDPVDENGKAIISKNEIRKWYNNDRAAYAKSKGASGVVFISKQYLKTQNYFKRNFKYRDLSLADQEPPFPSFYINEGVFYNTFNCDSSDVYDFFYGKINKRLRRKFNSIDTLGFTIRSNREIVSSSNVFGKLESANPYAPWIVLTAHYDHEGVKGDKVYNGADDNASGTSSVIEIAKAMRDAQMNGEVFYNNVLFMLVSGEEKGLLGSKYYVEHPIVPLEKTLCNLNIDMIGRIDKKHEDGDEYVYIIGSDRISNELHLINEEMNDLYIHLDLDYTYNAVDDPNQYYSRSDHYNFAKNGVPVIFYYNGEHEDYHKPTDTEEKIVYSLLKKRSRLVFHTTWFLAKMPKSKLN
jgi:hypothetical protein